MTLRQFAFLAGGIVIALLFFYSPFPAFFKYPFVILFGLGGVGLAFFPVNDMPLDRFVIAFFKSVYSPTQFFWHKQEKLPEFFTYQPVKVKTVSAPPPKPQVGKLGEFLQTIPRQESALDRTESNLLATYTSLLNTPPPAAPISPVMSPQPLTFRPSPMPIPSNPQPVEPRPRMYIEPEPKKPITPVPEKPRVAVPKPQPTQVAAQRKPVTFSPASGQAIPTDVTPLTKTAPSAMSQPPKTAQSTLVFPAPPYAPNVVVGMVLTPEGKLLEGAILEIRDADGHPVRALKTNKVGQFTIVAPLRNGTYELETEKDGFSFDIIKFEARGDIIPPIEIRAKSVSN